MNDLFYDKIIIGAGLYGLYSADYCARKGEKVLVIEREAEAFARATYVNQARVHQGYHYPRSLSTAIKSAGYFQRFNDSYPFCINGAFTQIYATSRNFSWTDGEHFHQFCRAAHIPCEEIRPERYFRPGMCDGAFETVEYTYDAMILRNHFLRRIAELPNAQLHYREHISEIIQESDAYIIRTDRGSYAAPYVLNATYASTNQILNMLGFEKYKIKYELCEIILCDAAGKLPGVGITVMDGPFFSIMPFGKTGLHSLTSVTFTPHSTSYDPLPHFGCQERSGGYCSPASLGNCNLCPARPASAFPFMSSLANKYLKPEYEYSYRESLFSMKPILVNSEIDDSRPTVIQKHSESPTFVSVLSGKINTVFDLDEVLDEPAG